jgi:molybdate-binding protein
MYNRGRCPLPISLVYTWAWVRQINQKRKDVGFALRNAFKIISLMFIVLSIDGVHLAINRAILPEEETAGIPKRARDICGII